MKCIFYDLETTGLDRKSAEIVQIGAVCNDFEDFDLCILPDGEISEAASDIHGFTKSRSGKSLKFKGELVEDPSDPAEALEAFMEFISEVTDPREEFQLIAHNGNNFDSWILCNNLVDYNVNVPDVVLDYSTFNDSLVLARMVERRSSSRRKGKTGLGLSDLMQKYLGFPQDPVHDALEDALNCRRVVRALANSWKKGRGTLVRMNEGVPFRKRYDKCCQDY